jgi:hypothetical protein
MNFESISIEMSMWKEYVWGCAHPFAVTNALVS